MTSPYVETICRQCHGTGQSVCLPGDIVEDCIYCGGTGSAYTCPECGGAGEIVVAYGGPGAEFTPGGCRTEECDVCQGSGFVGWQPTR